MGLQRMTIGWQGEQEFSSIFSIISFCNVTRDVAKYVQPGPMLALNGDGQRASVFFNYVTNTCGFFRLYWDLNMSHQTGAAVKMWTYYFIFISIITIHHELGLSSPVSVSSNSLFRGLPSRLCAFDLQVSIIFGILLLIILVTCCSQFDLYLRSFLVNWFYFQLFQTSFIPFVVKSVYPVFFWQISVLLLWLLL
jgi:hypothetical protein